MTGADIIIETLIEQGTEVVFGYPGGQAINIYDAIYKRADRIKHVLTAHEQGAAHAADGYARASGKVGVVIATSGPGATNLVTGIANAYLDSIPVVAITGNVPCSLIGRDSFQEVDIVGITMPIVKHNYCVKDVTKLADTIREAFKIAKEGRPGPVLIDVPKDVQIADIPFENKPILPEKPDPIVSETDLNAAIEMINASKRPYIYCGGGVVSKDAGKEVEELAELIDAPVGFSMMGLAAIPHSNPRALGMIGMHGKYSAIKIKSKSDLIIALGVRFSDRATGNKNAYMPNAKILHIDIDPAELDKNINSTLGIVGNVKSVIAAINKRLEKTERPYWQNEIENIKALERTIPEHKSDMLTPYKVVDTVAAAAKPTTPIATDVGQHQMWVAQRYPFEGARTLISSGGLGTMGFGLGAAIGACMATNERTVLFTGDGSFGMNLNELATAVSQKLPIVIVLMNNGVLGMVRQWQTMFFNKHYSQTTLERKTDFVKLAEAFGAKGMRANTPSELEECVKKAFASDGPVVIDCYIDKDERVLPMIPPGGTMDDLVVE